ncbi:MAG: 3-deoxy-manno-octulosonate cytidylyltransferase [Deltaproteobacteria bacterium]|nr:3-deoxy-manno-octulosonate cytidylyltransferase [Deltaproteobacteria bacterium]
MQVVEGSKGTRGGRSKDGHVVAVIPARYSSKRFPGKALAPVAGRPMVVAVWERVREARGVDRVIVATDDERIRAAVHAAGGEVVMTSPDHPSGTDRVAEAVRGMDNVRIVVNVQGDEPLVNPEMVEALAAALEDDSVAVMATLSTSLADCDRESHNVVKVVTDASGLALYFSRAPLVGAARHIGLYAYRREFLMKLAKLPPTALEMAESLEQLRVLEHGYRIRVVPSRFDTVAVDTPEDLVKVECLLAERDEKEA